MTNYIDRRRPLAGKKRNPRPLWCERNLFHRFHPAWPRLRDALWAADMRRCLRNAPWKKAQPRRARKP